MLIDHWQLIFQNYLDLMGPLLKGVEMHLHSPIENLRTLGMVVGENLMNDLNEMNFSKSDEPSKRLKFEVYFTVLINTVSYSNS